MFVSSCRYHTTYNDRKMLSCSGFPKCRGREGFGGLDEAEQKDLQKQWDAHVKEHPLPEIRTADGRVLRDEDNYVPRLLEDVA